MAGDTDRIVVAVEPTFKGRVVQEAGKRRLTMAAFVRFALEKVMSMDEVEQSRFIADGMVVSTTGTDQLVLDLADGSFSTQKPKQQPEFLTLEKE